MCRVLGHIQWENHGWSFGLICFSGNIISVLYMLSPVWVVILVYVSSRVLKYLVSNIAYNWRKTWNAICRPTFSRIVKHRSTEEFESLPYVSSLATSSLWVFYGLMKSGGLLIATVNGFGIIIELVYVILFLIFAPTRMRVKLYTVILQLYIPIYDYDHMCICIFFIHSWSLSYTVSVSGQDCHTCCDFECGISSRCGSDYSYRHGWRFTARCIRDCLCSPKYINVWFTLYSHGKNLEVYIWLIYMKVDQFFDAKMLIKISGFLFGFELYLPLID